MPTAPYHLADGTRVPGTTTIIGRFKESGGLIHWAWECGRDGKDYRQERDRAADAGTLAHEMIEQFVAGSSEELVEHNVWYDETLPDEVRKGACQGFKAFLEWKDQTHLKIVEQEMHLVSETYRYGGTPDAVGEIHGELALLDWKTSNRIYSDYLDQIAAYRNLWTENRPDQPLKRFYLLRFGKEFGDFHHHSWPAEVIDIAWNSFLHKRPLYDMDKTLKRACG